MHMDLTNIIDHLEDKDEHNFRETALTISKCLEENKTTIIHFIESLKDLLTNHHASKRDLGVSLLTEVLKNISFELLNKQQLEVLAEFYANKLNDHHQVLPSVLSGILTIIQFKNFPGEKVPKLLNSIFKHVPCQQQQRADRVTIYKIFELALRLFKEELLEMKLEFVYMVLTTVDGERDPRNLLFLFKWMKVFLLHFSLQHLTEDIFDILACYFPIDFKAPQSEATITRDDLAEALYPCLCAIPDFGDSCIALALEKLDSSLDIAKRDSLKLLKEGCSTFPTSVYLEKAPEIWSLIQKEILTTDSDQIKLQCLVTLSAVISKVSEDTTDSYQEVMQNILDTLKGNLLPDSRLFEKSHLILVYAASGSERSCNYIAKEAVPILTNIYNMTAYADQRSVIVKALVEFAKVHLKYHKNLNSEEVPELLQIPTLCLEVLNYGEGSRQIGFDCLKVLIPYLSSEIRIKLYSCLQSSIIMRNEIETTHSCLDCLKIAAKEFPDEVKIHIFTGFVPQPVIVDSLLNAMIVLVNLTDFRQYVIHHFIQALNNSELSKIAIKNIRCLVEEERKNTTLLKELIDNKLLHCLIQLVTINNYEEIDILKDISKILQLLIAPQTVDLQKDLFESHYSTIFEKIRYSDLNLIVMDGLVSFLRRNIQVDYTLLDVCYTLAMASEHEYVRKVAVELLANLVNKMTNDERLIEFLTITKEKCTDSVIINSKLTIITSSWITKGLLIRNHSYGMSWLDWLVQLLETNKDVPGGFRIIMDDSSNSLSLDAHCNKLSIYKQKTFVYVTNKIIENYTQNHTEYLTALGYLLEFTPIQAILLQFAKLSRLILLCLEKAKDSQVLIAVLTFVNKICNSNTALIDTHLEDYLDRILKLTVFESSMKVRIEAIRCITVFTQAFPLYKLLPFKRSVVYQLGICIDDNKRLVRREAMEARFLWFLLDAPM